jgi:hypothetical protein
MIRYSGKLLFLFSLLTAAPARALWVKQFGVSDVIYKIHVMSADAQNITYGFYLTSFPCYAQNSSEYFDTRAGKNIITLYCLEPPKSVMLGFLTRPRWEFVPKTSRMDGYMLCPVAVAGAGVNSAIPRLEVDLDQCEKRQLGASANKDFIGKGASADAAGKLVGELAKPIEEAEADGVAPSLSPGAGGQK